MADKYFLSIIGEMDRLWYRQVILFSQPTTLVVVAPKPVENENHVPISESPSSSSSIFSLPPLLDGETSTDESPSPEIQVSSESISLPFQDDSTDKKDELKERLDRMNNSGNRIRSHSSSPSTHNRHRRLKKSVKLQKSMSCRTLGELELDEVKGFMDLGFIFKKEYISPRMMSVVPGLQRLCLHQKNKQHTQLRDNATEMVQGNDIEVEEEEEEEEKRDIMRPYLAEAWLIKRPDSPLLSLKIPKPCSAANMKRHLRFWAKTVASEIQLE